jgi:hypothetical protein
MRRLLTVVAIAAVASVLYATSAPGAQQAEALRARQFVALQKQVRAMQKRLRALQRRTTLVTNQIVWTLEMIETAMKDGETCFAAVAADEFQNTWSQIDRLAVSLGAQPIFGIQTALDDRNACRGLSVPRPPLNPSVAPTVAPFKGLIVWLNGG